jgi:hypothetical protein
MAKINNAELLIGWPGEFSGKREWSIKFDEHLDALLDVRGIEDPDEQSLVCGALAAIGLAELKTFYKRNDTLYCQEYYYTSTKAMRRLAREWLYSGKFWGR